MADLFDALGKLATAFQAAPSGVPHRIWAELGPWFARLAVNAAPKWLPRLSFGFPCSVPVYAAGEYQHACQRPAVALCDVCGKPCCLDHARIDQQGDAICFLCVVDAINRKLGDASPPPPGGSPPQKPPPSREELTWARKALGVKKDTPWEEVQSQRRRLLAKWHPDRYQQDPGEAARADAKFKEIERAFGILSAEQARKEAA